MYQDLSTRNDWPVKNAIVDLPIRMKGNSKQTSSSALNPLGAQNNDLGAASQTLLTKVTLLLRRRLERAGRGGKGWWRLIIYFTDISRKMK